MIALVTAGMAINQNKGFGRCIMRKFDDLNAMISNTPLVEITFSYCGSVRKVFAKAEYFNLTGSIKDRVALHILKKAYADGSISNDDMIVEATSGNTGISFSAVGTYMGHKVVIYMPDWMTVERINLMKSFGAEVRLVSREEGGFLGSIAMTEELYKQGGVFLPKQFSNDDNTMAHFYTTGAEIVSQLAGIDRVPDAVIAGVGTGGTIMGIGKRLRAANPNCRVHPLEPSNSPTLSTGYKVGQHRIYGISDEFIPDIVKLNEIDSVVSVDDSDAIIMAQKLSRELGIGVGVSSGANFLGAVLAGSSMPEDATVVTVFADDNKKYLSTDYSKPQEMKESFVSKDITLLDVKTYR